MLEWLGRKSASALLLSFPIVVDGSWTRNLRGPSFEPKHYNNSWIFNITFDFLNIWYNISIISSMPKKIIEGLAPTIPD